MKARLSEPSTWAGFAGLLAAFGVNFAPALIEPISAIFAGLSAVAIVLRENRD